MHVWLDKDKRTKYNEEIDLNKNRTSNLWKPIKFLNHFWLVNFNCFLNCKASNGILTNFYGKSQNILACVQQKIMYFFYDKNKKWAISLNLWYIIQIIPILCPSKQITWNFMVFNKLNMEAIYIYIYIYI